MANQGTIQLGPWGGEGGVAWDYKPPSADSSILEIIITYGDIVNSLCFRSTGEPVPLPSPPAGGKGPKTETININGPAEYLNSISGTIDKNGIGDIVVQSLTFGTNTHSYGPYPTTQTGTPFTVPLKNGEIVGFFGRATAGATGYINAIGIQARLHTPA